MTIIPNAYLRNERSSLAANEMRAQVALEKARRAVATAIETMPGTVRKMVEAVNLELTEVPNSQQIARCTIQSDSKVEAMSTILKHLKAIEQELDDLVFQPMQLLSREAGEE